MKLLIASCLSIIAIAFTGTATVRAAPVDEKKYEHFSVIDNVNVPLDVLVYAQTEYLGHAVTQVVEINRGNHKLYQLRVDRDDIPDDHESIHLIYDKDWHLLGDQKIAPPPRRIEVEVSAPPAEEPVIEQDQENGNSGQQQPNNSSPNSSNNDEGPVSNSPRKEEKKPEDDTGEG